MNKSEVTFNGKIAYIAGAYRADTPEETELNIAAAKHVGKIVARLGYGVIIPHCNTAGMERIASDIPDSFWLSSTIKTMLSCDLVVMVAGWQFSSGATNERRKAILQNIPVFDSVDELVTAKAEA